KGMKAADFSALVVRYHEAAYAREELAAAMPAPAMVLDGLKCLTIPYWPREAIGLSSLMLRVFHLSRLRTCRRVAGAA
ncbi:hypothetical protein ACC675_37330, partial [Rhizobium ruizarguesonis]